MFHACLEAKIWTFFRQIYFDFFSHSLFSRLHLFLIYSLLLPTLSFFFCMELWLANLLGKGEIIYKEWWNWQWIFPQNVNLSEIISKTRYQWEHCLKWKLSGSIEENKHCLMWGKNNPSCLKRVKVITLLPKEILLMHNTTFCSIR